MSAKRAPRTGGLRRALGAVVARFTRAPRSRALEAGGGGKRWPWNSLARNPAASIRPTTETAAARAQHFALNNIYANAAVELIASSAIGEAGPRPQPQHGNQGTRDLVTLNWSRWWPRAGVNGEHGADILRLAVATMVTVGEAFISLLIDDDGALRLAVLDTEQIDRARTVELGDGARIVEGVEFDTSGRVIAFWVFPDRPSNPVVMQMASERIAASEVLHLKRDLVPGQVRGVTWFAASLTTLAEIDSCEDAMLTRIRVAALFGGFILDKDGQAGLPGEEADGVLDVSLEPGAMHVLTPGRSVEFPSTLPQAGDAPDFIKMQLRGVAASLGVSYEALTADLSGTNYSSIKFGQEQHRRRIGALRRQVLEPRLDQIFARWLALEILAGRINAPADSAEAADLNDCEWVWPAWPMIDALKETDAEVAAIAAGLKSRREVIAASGRDPDSVMADIAAEPPPPPPAKPQAEPEADAA